MSARHTRHTHHRRAYTLFEIILVMAIIVVAASLTIPVVRTMLTDARISASADTVRGLMAEARARALAQGRPWRVGFIANTGVYQLAPDDASDWDNPIQEPAEQVDLIRDVLPKEIVFALNDSDIAGGKESGPAGSKWETAAVYLGDGSARDDTTVYFGKPSIVPMRIRVRSLTGAVVVEAPTQQMQMN
jgi:prepilin-type N-terminal cleavage/methylation domain-containing protein